MTLSPVASWALLGVAFAVVITAAWWLWAPDLYRDPLDPDLDAEDFAEWEKECEADRRERRKEFFA